MGFFLFNKASIIIFNKESIGNVELPEDTFGLGEDGVGEDSTSNPTNVPLNTEDPFNLNSNVEEVTASVEVAQNQPQVNNINDVVDVPNNDDGIKYTQIISAQSELVPNNTNVINPIPNVTQVVQNSIPNVDTSNPVGASTSSFEVL